MKNASLACFWWMTSRTLEFFIKAWMEEFGGRFELVWVGTSTEAVEAINASCFDAVILDMRLPDFSGASVGDLIRESDANIPMAYLTNLDTEDARAHAVSVRTFY